MARRDWLLLFMGYKGEGGTALDPVRIQKGMFLFAQESELKKAERYKFEPFHYGPYSFDLRSDVDELVRAGLVRELPVPGSTWSRYVLSEEGMASAKRLLKSLPRDQTRLLYGIKQRVTGVSFNKLLRGIYAEYPDFATRTIFSR